MIKSKYINLICCIIILAAVVFTCLFMFGKLSFVTSADINSESPYASKLFDTSYVHAINIDVTPDDWQSMLDNAQAEEYISCNVTIDGTTINNVGIRPKGNTSLSSVSQMNSERYSFKIKFDKYDNDTNYMGLDKLALNNIIQDNTYMKDYFSYRMMNEIGADAPLCSFSYITVNNSDWGLYLAVEGIDKSFAKRSYGSDFGEIYKPESMAMGDDFHKGGMDGGEMPQPPNTDGEMPDMQVGEGMPQPPNMDGERPDMKSDEEMLQPPNTDGEMHDMQRGGEMPQPPNMDGKRPDMQGGMRNDTVALVYQGDDTDDYSAIFDYAVFSPDNADKKRLINSIKQLNDGEVEDSVNIEEVLRYFAAHNFTVNFDSYTGSMMHNYYLYEKDGKMSMIAWDYNLAFGSFSGGPGGGRGSENNRSSSTQYVNYPIDTPVSGTTLEDRPMLGKLLEKPEYTERYHEIFDEFITDYFESGKFENEYNRVFNMIAEYVQKDPTKFCTFDEFLKGAETLKQFCSLRTESVRGQLNGTIPSTTEGQQADSSALIDAAGISLNDMGSMNTGMKDKGFPPQRRE